MDTAIDPYLYSRSIRGVPSPNNRVPRGNASDNGWKRGMAGRTVGIAPGTESTSDGTATVRVIYADGRSEIRSANSFRKENIHRKNRQHVQATAHHRIMAGDLAPIGNVE